MVFVFLFKQKTAYEMRISDWSSDVCSTDLPVTVADILCESTNQVAALAGVQLGRQSQLILPRYLGVLTLLRCLGRVPQRRSVLRPLRAFRHDDERILNPAPSRVVVHQAVALVFEGHAGTIRDRRDGAAPGRTRHRFYRQMVDRHRSRAFLERSPAA